MFISAGGFDSYNYNLCIKMIREISILQDNETEPNYKYAVFISI